MKILIVAPRYPFKDNMEFVFVKKLVDEWAKMGHKCVVVSAFSKTAYFRRRISYRPLHYSYRIGGHVIDVYNPRYFSFGINICGCSIDLWNASNAIERQIKKTGIKFDLLYCHFFSSALIAFRYALNNKLPFFIATGESEIGSLSKPYPNFKWEVFRSYTTGVIAVSSKNKMESTKMGYIDEAKCAVFPNGTDTTLFKPLDRLLSREKLGLPLNAFIIICVGFICERKGQNRLLEAVRKLNNDNIKLVFIGAAAAVESFRLDGEEIIFNGTVNNTELPTYLCASDVFCLPTRAEGCCNAIIEALACGIPIISSNLLFNWDVLDNSNSIMVNPDNVNEIANAIQCLIDNEKRRLMLSDGAIMKAKSLGIHQRADNILNYIIKRIH